MNWPAGKRLLARCSKNTSSGTRPGTATTCHPVCFINTSLSRRKSGIWVGADGQVAHPLHELLAGAAREQLRLTLEQRLPDGMFVGRIVLPALVDCPVGPLGPPGLAGR